MSDPGSAWPALTSWHVTEVAAVLAAVAVPAIAISWREMGRRQRLLLTAGFMLCEVLLTSDVQGRAMTSYRCHMIEHIIVILCLAPLVAAAIPLRLSRTSATVAFLAFTVVVPVYHLTRLGGFVMGHSGGHYLELASFLVIGTWFWLPVYGPSRVLGNRQRVAYVALALPVIATTGLVEWSSTSASLATSGMGMSMPTITVADVRNGGLVMMVLGTAVMLAHLAGMMADSGWRAHLARQPVGRRVA